MDQHKEPGKGSLLSHTRDLSYPQSSVNNNVISSSFTGYTSQKSIKGLVSLTSPFCVSLRTAAMAPVPVAPIPASDSGDVFTLKLNNPKTNGNGTSYDDKVSEDYMGNYRFAPIEEADVSRAMIGRSVLSKALITVVDTLRLKSFNY